jgi:DNA-binding MarR family transcriptional regulator
MPTKADPAHVASDLRVVLGQLIRRLRAENRFPLSQASVLGRLDRCGADGFVTRRPDPDDRRRALVELTDEGLTRLQADRAARDGWLARAIADKLSPADQDTLESAVELLRQLADS